jgi:hypothetical protein
MMRTERLLAAVVIVGMSAITMCEAVAQLPPAASAPAVLTPGSMAVELAKALAWPLVALLIAGVFRRPIALFVSALGNRITKISLFKLELTLSPATAATTTPLLDDIRTATNSAMISDSSRAMLEQVQSNTPADFAEIALGDGKEWLTSRLYIAAVMMARMRGVKVFVFVEHTPNTERRFVAVTSVRQLRWALARRYPWLEAAWTRVQLEIFPAAIPANAPALPAGAQWLPDPRTLPAVLLAPPSVFPTVPPQPLLQSNTGALASGQARQCVSKFIDSVQRQLPPGPAPDDAEWVTLRDTIQERAAWVTRELLVSLLPREAFNNSWTYALRDSPRAQRTRAVLRRSGTFVALVEGNREFLRLANRQSLLEEIAAALGEEPEDA